MSKVFTITEGLENMGALKTGGQGSVYKTRRTGTIITAVKLLPTPIMGENASDKNYTDFVNEVTKLKRVNEEISPNVVKILSSGLTESGSFPYIEMEFIEGPDLEELLKAPHAPVFTIKEAIKVAEHLSNALAHCHKLDIKHGDIKSNNVKFSQYTGNYVLLDFGLALMSDEQRRTSLRNAGAIEFMAPEQANGEMLFETDVYSFGVILFELLAGQVPFPLQDKTETARNMVLVAHMENQPPDIMELRKQNLPDHWSEEKTGHEMKVPQWLWDVIYRCLEKAPEKRFANGMELHNYILKHSVLTVGPGGNTTNDTKFAELQQENQRLHLENQRLQQLLNQQSILDENARVSFGSPLTGNRNKRRWFKPATLAAIAVTAVTIFLLVLVFRDNGTKDAASATGQTAALTNKYYRVVSYRAYFHNEPDRSTRRNAFLVRSDERILALDERDDFIYTEYTNSQGQTSKGWVLKDDLEPANQQSEQKKTVEKKPLSQNEIRDQLADAARRLETGDTRSAIDIYEQLSKEEVPEAMYHYSDLALRNRNTDISCEEAGRLMQRAADKGYTPARRTLGFLYVFAGDRYRMAAADYMRCEINQDVEKGSDLLMQAALEGDGAAQQILDEFNELNSEEP
ncbi:MAG: protein kinase [Flavipsychrobacter sp.]|jgi:serine/threonine-protein kinase|nr:protein kinase [Flavipsychrobacter sp.]